MGRVVRAVAFACALAVTGTSALAPNAPRAGVSLRLDVTSADGHIVWSTPVQRGDRFDLVFTHSSERCRWVHHYEVIDEGRIEQLGSAFPCFGPGMPTQPASGPDETDAGEADAAGTGAAEAHAGADGRDKARPASARRFGRSRDGYEAVAPLRLDAIRMMNWRPAGITLRHDGREQPIGQAMANYATFTLTVRAGRHARAVGLVITGTAAAPRTTTGAAASAAARADMVTVP